MLRIVAEAVDVERRIAVSELSTDQKVQAPELSLTPQEEGARAALPLRAPGRHLQQRAADRRGFAV